MIQLTQQIKTEWEDTIRCAWWVCWSHLLIHCKEYRDRIWPALTPSVTLTTCRWDLLPGRCWASNTNSDRCICIMTGNNNVLSKWRETLACYLCLLWLLWDTESFLPAKELLVRRLFKLFHQDTVFHWQGSIPPVNDLELLAQTTVPHPGFQKDGSVLPEETKTSCFCSMHRWKSSRNLHHTF